DQLPTAQIADAEAACRGRASHDGAVVTVADADDDQFEVELVRPEPRHLVVHGGDAEQVESHGGSLLEGIVDRLEAQVPAVPAVQMARTVASRVDRLISRAAIHVRDYTVLARKSSGPRELVHGCHSDAHDHQVRRVLAASFREHGPHPPGAVIAVKRAHTLVAADAHAVPRVLGFVERGYLRTRDAA